MDGFFSESGTRYPADCAFWLYLDFRKRNRAAITCIRQFAPDFAAKAKEQAITRSTPHQVRTK